MNIWSVVAPYPEPLEVSADYRRHAPSVPALRSTITSFVTAREWAKLSWSELVEGLLAIGRTDVPLARLAEGHIDAMRILRQADLEPEPEALYGVWASRSQQTGVRGRRGGDQLIMDGMIKFASGAGVLDRALVPVWLDADHHLLVDLAVDQLPVDESAWVTSAMAVSRSHTVTVDGVSVASSAVIGLTDFYLSRPAFLPGGVGVAACWAGGAARIADLTVGRLRDPQGAVRARLGRIRIALTAAAATLDVAGRRLDDLLGIDHPDVDALRVLSSETRATVATAVHTVLDEATRVAGPAGLAFDAELTHAIDDLRLYVLQQNADSDEAFLGGIGG